MEELIKLFLSFLKVGSLSFGGAYSLLPVIENETVRNHAWLTNDEFLKVLSMVEIIPGAISIKFATYTGYKVAGIPGVIAANLGNLTTPVILISLAAYFYSYIENHDYVKNALNGVKFAILGMILAIVYQYMIKSYDDWLGFLFLAAGFILTVFLRLNPVYIVAITGFAAIIIYRLKAL
jgi:chromate transporter